MDFQVLISTQNPDPNAFRKLGFNKLIISQNPIGVGLDEDTLKFISVDETGLSKSRNRALQECEATFALIADDDLEYCEDFEDKVAAGFRQFPDADILTYKIISPEGKPYKSYKASAFKHTRTSIYKVSSVEMVFRMSSVKAKGLRFDERFGLGSEFKSGEETIFLNDALDAGMNLYYIPEYLVIHPIESSGKLLDLNFFYSKGALIKRLYGGSFKLILGLLFLIKQVTKPQNKLTLAASIQAIKKGYYSIK